MRLNLRIQLLASYLTLLAVTLSVIAAALLVFLNTRPAPPEPTFQRLSGLAEGLNLRGFVVQSGREFNRRQLSTTIASQLDEYAETRDVRVLLVNTDARVALFDSGGGFVPGEAFPLRVTAEAHGGQPGLRIFGDFADPAGNEWLFTGVMGPRSTALIVADERPNQSVQVALAQFGDALLIPILQAGLVGLLVAIGLAGLISRGVARPLQTVAQAASAVAERHYNQQVPVSGPPEVRAVGEAFNHMTAQVRAAQQAQQDFLANVSHDLKTPLTSIQGYSQAIIDGAAKNPRQAAAVIHEEASRLNRMVVELTDLTRLEAGRLSMQSAPIDMGQIVAAVGQRLSIVAGEKAVGLHLKANPMPEIAGDGDRLAQVMTNLISNAIKFTPAGGHVWVETQMNGGGVEVVVRDDGLGLSPDEHARVFERFYQADKVRGPARGTGLGLAITREIVHAHGGKISVASPGRGKGTTFTIWLPSPHLSTVIRERH